MKRGEPLIFLEHLHHLLNGRIDALQHNIGFLAEHTAPL